MGSLFTIEPIFKQRQVGAVCLQHRVVQAPCPRMRSSLEWKGVYIPNDLNGENEYPTESLESPLPLRYEDGKVTDAVYGDGSFTFCRLWYVGRAIMASFIGGCRPLISSDIPITGKTRNGTEYARPMAVPKSTERFDGLNTWYLSLRAQIGRVPAALQEHEYGRSIANRGRYVVQAIEAIT
ncbi:hypothetical protein CFD26_100733 [Aspergillus turcosus]|uniref:Uncharacterized protein n=1 Tax=Aspergillus turcosus TaxID=1245748 RepID=A0A3R7JIE9_9EURO|nr:hypothetical protein CFD26_100733 [Aspergillus turcosus]